jgi:hypothetical protein
VEEGAGREGYHAHQGGQLCGKHHWHLLPMEEMAPTHADKSDEEVRGTIDGLGISVMKIHRSWGGVIHEWVSP